MGQDGGAVAAADQEQQQTNKTAHLVLDTGALIKGQGYRLAAMAERFWTVPEVIAEVRDPKSRFHLASLPFELHTKEPTPEAVKAVCEFARRTGDYPSLSRVDLRVLALAYTLEAEQHGGSVAHLRTVPATPLTVQPVAERAEGKRQVGSGGEEGEEEEEEEEDGGSSSSDEGEEEREEEEEEEEGEEEEAASAAKPAAAAAPAAGLKPGFSWAQAVKTAAPPMAKPAAHQKKASSATAEAPAIPLETPLASLSLHGPLAPPPLPATPPKKEGEVTSRFLGAGARTAATMGGDGGAGEDGGDDGQGWIGIDNLQEARARGSEAMFMGPRAGGNSSSSSGGGGTGAVAPPPPPAVACVTTDFGMQNVLLQLGLHLLALDGARVSRVKRWIRRCDACAKLVQDPDRMFCPRCGNAYLSRASVSVDRETGQLKVHLSKLWRPRKGCKYSIPKPDKHGRFEGDLLLREDQLMMGIWRQRVKRRTKVVGSMFGSDVTESLGLAVGRTAAQEGIEFGYGRKNPNSQKGRERRGKKKRGGTGK